MTDKVSLRAARLNARQALARAGCLDFKPVSSAKWIDIERDWNGQLHMRIEHDTVRGCTPEMLRWWFENLGRTTKWDGIAFEGPEVSFYHLWHHRDHVAITPISGSKTGFIEGGLTGISEQFNDYRDVINVETLTEKLTDRENTFVVKRFGMTLCRIIHLYSPEEDGSRWYTETIIGSGLPVVGWFLNWLVMPWIYSKATGEHWIRHNIEETGRSESVIPVLYDHHHVRSNE